MFYWIPMTLTLNFRIAFPRASIVSMSKWLVGSSKIKKLGLWPHNIAKATRDFWPPDKLHIWKYEQDYAYEIFYCELLFPNNIFTTVLIRLTILPVVKLDLQLLQIVRPFYGTLLIFCQENFLPSIQPHTPTINKD